MPAVYDNFLNKAKKYYAAARNKDKEAKNKIFDEQEKVANDTYNKAVKDTKISYEDQHRENAIQKLINENEVAEDMANMGHNDSGLNRTQQTAVQLSYANNKSSINRQKQAQLDSFAQSLASELSTIRQNRISSIAAIDQQYDSAAVSAAQDAYQSALDAETARVKSYYSSSNSDTKLNKLAYGTLATASYRSNGKTVYTDINGNSVALEEGSNPYTGYQHKDVLNEDGKYDKSKVFSNGYQPNNINGTPLNSYKGEHPKEFIPDHRTDGQPQKIWVANNQEYAWDGSLGDYFPVKWDEKTKTWDWA